MKPVSGSSFLLLLSFLFLTNCAENKAPREPLVKTYVEDLIAQESYSYNADSLRVHQEKIFKENNITRESFRDELQKLQNDQDAWDMFFKRSHDMLDSLKHAGKVS